MFLLRQARGLMSLSLILGTTWFIGVVNTFLQARSLTYLFTVLNSLQGLFIFIFHVVLSRAFRQLVRQFSSWFLEEAAGSNTPKQSSAEDRK